MPQKRILVLEDEPDVRDVWVEALEDAGYAAVGIMSGAEALARIPDLAPDLILLDMMMPGMDGFEFLARVRKNPLCAEIPVLIISALGDALVQAIDRRGARTLGVVGILAKPAQVRNLLERVEEVIGPGR